MRRAKRSLLDGTIVVRRGTMDPQQILDGLARVANEGIVVAIVWHCIIGAALIALAMGWRPSRRWAGVLLAIPLASVSAFGWAFQNPVNGSVFAALSAALIVLAFVVVDRQPVSRGSRWSVVVGACLLAFGWLYPHFLERAPFAYAIAAPLGLLPCPTLVAVSGLAILGNGLGSRAWSWTLASAASFYALFGWLRLGVWLDVALLAGALALVGVTWIGKRRPLDRGQRRLRIDTVAA